MTDRHRLTVTEKRAEIVSRLPVPALTIVVPTLNSEATLDTTLASLKSTRIRVIVADSFSTDATLSICSRWNVETISVPAGNMYAGINAGLRAAQTDWVGYVNSDDLIFTSAYLEMLHRAMEGEADITYASADYMDADGRFLFSVRPSAPKVARRILRAGCLPFCQPAAIFRRKVFQALGGFDERYRAASDFDFFFRAVLVSKYRLSRSVGKPVAAFRLHPAQISATAPGWDRREKADMRKRYQLGSNPIDRLALLLWQFSNAPWYLERLFRHYQLSRHLTITKSSYSQE